jgi:DNA-binding response OmpR family regulator
VIAQSDADFCEALAMLVGFYRHDAVIGWTVDSARELALAEATHVVFCDVPANGPEDSLQLARHLRADGFQGLIVVLTGITSESLFEAGWRAGVDDVLVKPVEARDVEAILQRAAALSGGPPA